MFTKRSSASGLCAVLLLLFPVFAGAGEKRIWTDNQGRKMEAELISCEIGGKVVKLRITSSNKVFQIETTTLSPDDRKYLAELARDVEPVAAPLEKASPGRIGETPDLMQTAVNNGENYCAPVSASNGLIWLGNLGYSRLLDGGDGGTAYQIELAGLLGSKGYMDAESGTGAKNMAEGLATFLKKKRYLKCKISYEGWREGSTNMTNIGSIPNLKTVRRYLDRDSGIFLNLGWYRSRGRNMVREGGHWVTVVGCNGDTIQVYDPASRCGEAKRLHEVRLTTLTKGELTGDNKGLPIDAKGFMSVSEGLVLKEGVESAVVDSIVYLEMDPDEKDEADRSAP